MGHKRNVLDGIDIGATVGARIRQRRRLLDLTQTELAARAGVHFITIHAIESGKQHPMPETVAALAAALAASASARAHPPRPRARPRARRELRGDVIVGV